MLKQSPSRNQRSKGFKVKHVLQIFLLLAICVWLLYQMKRSHDKKKAYDEESSSTVLGKMQSGSEFVRLGRRDLRPLVKDASSRDEKREGKEEEEVEEEVEEGMGGGDDEIDVHDRERAEEEESEGADDLIDEEDRERDEGSEEYKGIDLEDVNLLEDQDEIEEGKSDLQEAKEERYKDDDDVESDVLRDIQGISRSLRKVQVEKVESANNEAEKETETYYAENSETRAPRVSMAKSPDSENTTSTYLDNIMSSNPLLKDEGNEQSKLRNGSMLLLVEDTALYGTKLNLTSNGRDSYLQTAIAERSQDPRAASVRIYSDSTFSTIDDSAADGSLSVVSHGTLQLDATAGSVKSASTNGGLYGGEGSSMTSTTNGNLNAVDDDKEEEEEKSIDSSDLSLSEENQEEKSVMYGL